MQIKTNCHYSVVYYLQFVSIVYSELFSIMYHYVLDYDVNVDHYCTVQLF
jgi:hypothetical protein